MTVSLFETPLHTLYNSDGNREKGIAWWKGSTISTLDPYNHRCKETTTGVSLIFVCTNFTFYLLVDKYLLRTIASVHKVPLLEYVYWRNKTREEVREHREDDGWFTPVPFRKECPGDKRIKKTTVRRLVSPQWPNGNLEISNLEETGSKPLRIKLLLVLFYQIPSNYFRLLFTTRTRFLDLMYEVLGLIMVL